MLSERRLLCKASLGWLSGFFFVFFLCVLAEMDSRKLLSTLRMKRSPLDKTACFSKPWCQRALILYCIKNISLPFSTFNARYNLLKFWAPLVWNLRINNIRMIKWVKNSPTLHLKSPSKQTLIHHPFKQFNLFSADGKLNSFFYSSFYESPTKENWVFESLSLSPSESGNPFGSEKATMINDFQRWIIDFFLSQVIHSFILRVGQG